MKQWKYQSTYATINNYLSQMNTHLAPECVLPHLAIAKLGRSQLCKYNHIYTNDGKYGEIVLNSMYIRDNPSNNEIVHYIMLAIDALCQHVVMCKNEGKKLAPHCSQVKTLLKKAGLVYNGKKPLSFTKDTDGSTDSALYAMLEQDYSEDVNEIAYIEPLPPTPRKTKVQPATDTAQNTLKFEQEQTIASTHEEVTILRKERDELLKTVRQLAEEVETLTNKLNKLQPVEEAMANVAN